MVDTTKTALAVVGRAQLPIEVFAGLTQLMGSVGSCRHPGGDAEVDGTAEVVGRPTTVPSLVATGGDERQAVAVLIPSITRACAEPPDATAGRRRGRWRSAGQVSAEAIVIPSLCRYRAALSIRGRGTPARHQFPPAGESAKPGPGTTVVPLRCCAGEHDETDADDLQRHRLLCRTIRPRTTAMAGSRAISVPERIGRDVAQRGHLKSERHHRQQDRQA